MTFHPENQRVWSMSPTQTGNTSATSSQFASLMQAPRRGCISRAITARPVRRCQRALSLCRWSFRFRARNRIEYGLCAQFPRNRGRSREAEERHGTDCRNKTRVVLIGPKAYARPCAPRAARSDAAAVPFQSGRPLGSMQWRLRPDARARRHQGRCQHALTAACLCVARALSIWYAPGSDMPALETYAPVLARAAGRRPNLTFSARTPLRQARIEPSSLIRPISGIIGSDSGPLRRNRANRYRISPRPRKTEWIHRIRCCQPLIERRQAKGRPHFAPQQLVCVCFC